MRKGYKETLPKNSHDAQGMPIWGAPAADSAKAGISKKTQERADGFRRDADKPVVWSQNIRTANGAQGRYGYLNFEALYRGFRQRLLEDQAFEGQVLELIMDRIMTELFVPISHTPRKGVMLKIRRKETPGGD